MPWVDLWRHLLTSRLSVNVTRHSINLGQIVRKRSPWTSCLFRVVPVLVGQLRSRAHDQRLDLHQGTHVVGDSVVHCLEGIYYLELDMFNHGQPVQILHYQGGRNCLMSMHNQPCSFVLNPLQFLYKVASHWRYCTGCRSTSECVTNWCASSIRPCTLMMHQPTWAPWSVCTHQAEHCALSVPLCAWLYLAPIWLVRGPLLLGVNSCSLECAASPPPSLLDTPDF